MLLIKWFRQEAVSVQGAAQALIGLGLAFGWMHWSPTQTGTVVALVAAMLAIVTRQQVTPIQRAPKSETTQQPVAAQA